MIKKHIKKLIALGIISTSILALNPIGASAEWKRDNIGWWYTDDDSWYTGWKEIDSKWYYFYDNGYMAHDTVVNGYILGSDGARAGEANGIYTWGRDLQHMNFQSTDPNWTEFKYSDPSKNEEISDNLNNKYTNYLTLVALSDYDGGGYSYIEFPLNGEYKQFKSLLGLTKDYQNRLESGTVKIYLDDKEVYKETLSSGDMLKNVDLNLTGKNKIKFYFGDCIGTKGYENRDYEKIGFFNGQFTK